MGKKTTCTTLHFMVLWGSCFGFYLCFLLICLLPSDPNLAVSSHSHFSFHRLSTTGSNLNPHPSVYILTGFHCFFTGAFNYTAHTPCPVLLGSFCKFLIHFLYHLKPQCLSAVWSFSKFKN